MKEGRQEGNKGLFEGMMGGTKEGKKDLHAHSCVHMYVYLCISMTAYLAIYRSIYNDTFIHIPPFLTNYFRNDMYMIIIYTCMSVYTHTL
jgi:hypothetical protein